jgi:hypothetical protein
MVSSSFAYDFADSWTHDSPEYGYPIFRPVVCVGSGTSGITVSHYSLNFGACLNSDVVLCGDKCSPCRVAMRCPVGSTRNPQLFLT